LSIPPLEPLPQAGDSGLELAQLPGRRTGGQGTPIPVGQDLSIFTNVSAGQGCNLPGAGVSPSEEYIIANHGLAPLNVYPPVGGTIGTLGTNLAYSLAAGSALRFLYLGNGAWTQGG